MTTVTAMATAADRPAGGPKGGPARVAARAAIILAALGLATLTVRTGLAQWIGLSDPVGAAGLAPHDARIAIAAAQAALGSGAKADSPQVRTLVDNALARDVTQPGALELKAVQADLAGQKAHEARLFALSDALSRRSLPTRLWLIQHAVDQGDVPGALADFDIALRTSSNAPKVLFPVLARATRDPHLTTPIARLLDRPDDWRLMFLNYAVTQAHAGPGMSAVVLKMRDRRVITDSQVDQTLVAELVAEQQFALARRVREAFRRTSPDLVQDADFSRADLDYPFGWRLTQAGDVGAQRVRVEGQTGLNLRASPSGSGPVATQLLTLAPGTYRLWTQTGVALADPAALPFWTLTCAQAGGGQIALLDQPAQARQAAAIAVTVPTDCPAQWLSLNLRPSDGEQSGEVARVAVSRP